MGVAGWVAKFAPLSNLDYVSAASAQLHVHMQVYMQVVG